MSYNHKVLGLCILLLLLLSEVVVADSNPTGNITVYVKDQQGNNIFDNPNLQSSLTAELFYEGNLVRSLNYSNNDTVTFLFLNHTGSYVVRASAKLRFVSEKNDMGIPFSCYYNAPGYLSRVDTPNCYNVCVPGGYTPYTCNDSCYVGFLNNRSGGVDGHGYYDCLNLGCDDHYQVWDSIHNVYVTVTRCTYKREHVYTEMNEVLTYVDANKSDTAQVTLLSDETSLGSYGRLYAENLLNLSRIQSKLNRSGLLSITDVGETGVGAAYDSLDSAIELSGAKNKKYLEHIYTGGFWIL